MILAPAMRPLPKNKLVTLSAALTWLRFDSAMELSELLEWSADEGVSEEQLRDILTDEWKDLSDYACDGAVRIRGREIGDSGEALLREDQLRNCRFVGWRSGAQHLQIDPFEFTFSGGFRSFGEKGLRAIEAPVVWREDLIRYKRVRPRRRVTVDPSTAWKDAQSWLNGWLSKQESMPGWKIPVVNHMVQRFGITRSRAVDLWTETATSLKWPLHGAPTILQREKLRSILADERVFE